MKSVLLNIEPDRMKSLPSRGLCMQHLTTAVTKEKPIEP
jgi:hypothetical protein